MLSKGDAVVYKCRGLYMVKDIGTLDFLSQNKERQYYTLQSVENAGERAYIPTDDETNIRRPVSEEEAMELIIPGLFEPPVRTLRATIPENESHIFR